MKDTKIIDIHSHIIPPIYLETLLNRVTAPKIEPDKKGSFTLWYGDALKFTFDKKIYSLDRKLEAMDKSGIDIQAVSLAMPGVDFLKSVVGSRLARAINDQTADFIDSCPDRFFGIATVYLRDIGEAVSELKRAITSLGFKGVEIFSNIEGLHLDDERFCPFYEEATKLDVPLLIHPTKPLMVNVMTKYGIESVVGFLFDTTLAILRMVLGGVFEKFPTLKIVLPHLGSTIPYLIGRIDNQFNVNPECRRKISKKPSEYLKQIYIDTGQSLYGPAIACALNFSGYDKILFGSDYPFADLKQSIEIVDAEIPEKYKEKVFYENAAKLFKLT